MTIRRGGGGEYCDNQTEGGGGRVVTIRRG